MAKDSEQDSEKDQHMIIQDRPRAFIGRAMVPAFVFVACIMTASDAMARSVLIENGQAQCYIVIPEGTDGRVLENSACRVLKAAHALEGYLETMSGTDVPIRWETDHCPGFRIYIGSTRLAPVDPADITQEKIGFDGFIIKSVPDGVVIAGRTDQGTANGVYHFAEEVLGMHWYTAEESGPTIPRRSTIEIAKLDMTVKPDFAWRGQYYSIITKYLTDDIKANRDAWWTFNRLWGISVGTGHVLSQIVPNSLFAEHPEYFALIDGKRKAGNVSVQRCFSNPDVVQLAIDYTRRGFERTPDMRFAALNANDGNGWCECDRCKAMGPTQAHRVLAFANAVAEANEKLYPRRGYMILAYLDPIHPPVDMKAHRNVVPEIATMGHCRTHSLLSDCPDSIDKRKILTGWHKVAGRLAWRPYLSGGPFCGPGVMTVAEDLRFVRDLGCIGGFREHTAAPQANWAMLNWMEVKLMWDVDLDPVKLRRQFIEGYYGPAAADAVERVYDTVENGLRNSPIAPRPNGHNFLPGRIIKPFVDACQADIDAALEIARTEKNKAYARRIARDMGALQGKLPPDLEGLLKE